MADSYAMQYDEQGKPYFQLPGQQRIYVSPVAMGGNAPADTTGIFRRAPQFNQRTGRWETPVDWSNIMSMVTAGLITAGAANAIMAAGAPAAAAPGTVADLGAVSGATLPGATTVSAAGTVADLGAVSGATLPGATTIGATGATEAFDAAGNFIGPSTVTGAGGGASAWQRILDTAGDVSNAIGGWEAGRQVGRNAENAANYNFDRAQQDQYRTQVVANANENDFGLGRYNADLNTSTAKNNFGLNRVNAGVNLSDADIRQKQFSLDAPKARARNAVQGDILSRAQDVTFSNLPKGINPPTISGGLRPSMFSDNTRQLGGLMSSQALASQQAGDTFQPLPDLPNYEGPSSSLPTYVKPPPPPGVTPPVAAGRVDSILNTAGQVSSWADILRRYLPQRS